RRGRVKRGVAITIAYVLLLAAIAAIGATFVPKLVDEVNGFVQALPDYVHDVTHGRGRLGFLETKYHVVEKVREQVQNGGAKKLLGLSGAALSVTKSVIILISLIAGTSATIVLLIMGVPYAVALGLLVAVLDLIPLAGATVAGIVVAIVAFLHSIPAGIVAVTFFIVYQQVENHVLQPVIYGRTVQLSPLAVLVSVLVGAELAGILGALAAIPGAGAIQVILRDQLAHRRRSAIELPPA